MNPILISKLNYSDIKNQEFNFKNKKSQRIKISGVEEKKNCYALVDLHKEKPKLNWFARQFSVIIECQLEGTNEKVYAIINKNSIKKRLGLDDKSLNHEIKKKKGDITGLVRNYTQQKVKTEDADLSDKKIKILKYDSPIPDIFEDTKNEDTKNNVQSVQPSEEDEITHANKRWSVELKLVRKIQDMSMAMRATYFSFSTAVKIVEEALAEKTLDEVMKLTDEDLLKLAFKINFREKSSEAFKVFFKELDEKGLWTSLLNLGDRLHAEGNFDEAEKFYEFHVKEHPTLESAQKFFKNSIYTNNFSNYPIIAKRILKSDDPQVMLIFAEIMSIATDETEPRNRELAIQLYERIEELIKPSQDEKIYLELGKLYLSKPSDKEDEEKAYQYFKKAADLGSLEGKNSLSDRVTLEIKGTPLATKVKEVASALIETLYPKNLAQYLMNRSMIYLVRTITEGEFPNTTAVSSIASIVFNGLNAVQDTALLIHAAKNFLSNANDK